MRITLAVVLFVTFSSLGQTSYTPDKALRNEVASALWEELKEKTPSEGIVLMEYLINSDEIFKLYESTIAKHGMQPYEIAVVAGFVEDVCNEIVTGISISDSQSIENVNKMKAFYKANEIDINLQNNEKQKKYDALILRAIWLGAINELADKRSVVAKAMAAELLALHSTSVYPFEAEAVTATVQGPEEELTPKDLPTKTVANNTNIKDVVMITTTSYGLGGMYISNDVYVLFANGECLKEPSEPVETMDIAASKRKNPKHWDAWEIKNNVFYITDRENGHVSDWENWFKVRPAKKGFVFNGTFKTSDPFTGGSIINSSTVYFDSKGRFEWKTTKGGIGGWRPTLVNKNSSGTYTIENRTITLNYGNGTSESLFFGLYPKDDAHFIVGTSHFVPIIR